jgi:hypothetical protein
VSTSVIRHKHNFPFWGFISDNNFAIFATHAPLYLTRVKVIQAHVTAETFILMAATNAQDSSLNFISRYEIYLEKILKRNLCFFPCYFCL